MTISAGSYVDKYGPDERYDILKFCDALPCPTLFTFGSIEVESGGIAFAELPDAISSATKVGGITEVVTVPKANHFYVGCEQALADIVHDWIGRGSDLS